MITDSSYLEVTVDCSSCSLEHLSEELSPIVDLTDLSSAKVRVTITEHPFGLEQVLGQVVFSGLREFTGLNDTLTYYNDPTNPKLMQANILAQTVKAGLVAYLARTDLAEYVSVAFMTPPSTKAPNRHYGLVVRTSANGSLLSQHGFETISLSAFMGVDRITPLSKVEFDISGSFNQSSYDVGAYDYTASTYSLGTSALAVGSLGNHWSVGCFSAVSSASARNIRLGYRVAPAIEFNMFDYASSTYEQLRISYRIGFERRTYNDTTMYSVTEEGLLANGLGLALTILRKWGSMSSTINASAYLDDITKNSLYVSGTCHFRVIKGLSISASATYGFIHDHLATPKNDATEEEILLHLNQSQTTYSFNTYLGLSYTLNKFSSVVNPRFGYGNIAATGFF
jgi:hypothetical protein